MRGEQTEFAQVYDEHVWRVYGFLAYRLQNRDLAEDLTQSTFERALRAWSRFDRRRASEATWLLAIARNLLIDYRRRERPRHGEPIDEHMLPSVPGPEQRLAGSPDLIEALARLGEREREVLALRFGGDLNGPEIAALLGLSLANVQQIVSRSLRKLRAILTEGDGQGASNGADPADEGEMTPSAAAEASAPGRRARIPGRWNQ